MRKKRKMQKSFKITLISLASIFTLFCILIGIIVFRSIKEEEILKQEVINVMSQDLATYDYQVVIKTKGDYAYVEGIIKNHFQFLASNIQDISGYLEDGYLKDVLSPIVLEVDRPDYKRNYNLINKARNKTKKAIKEIQKLCSENTIKNSFDKAKVGNNNYYYRLYLDLIYTKQDQEHFSKLQSKMEYIYQNLTAYLDKLEEVLHFLEEVDDKVEYSEDRTYFQDDELLQKYKEFMIELDDIEEEMMNTGKVEESDI